MHMDLVLSLSMWTHVDVFIMRYQVYYDYVFLNESEWAEEKTRGREHKPQFTKTCMY